MELDLNGVSIDSLKNYLSAQTEKLKKFFDSDFYIKPEGVIDNIATSIVLAKFLLLQQLLFYIKQIDTNTAEAEYLDALLERIGLYRISANYTIFSKSVFGNPDTIIPTNSVTIRNVISKEEFTNNEQVIIDANGKGTMQFQAVIAGKININENDTFEIAQNSSDNFIGLCDESAFDIVTGREEETDTEFRERFWNSKNMRSKCTRNAIIKNLREYVEHPQYLFVLDCNSDISINAGYILIIAKPSVSDFDFARAISENVLCGIKFLGNTLVNVPISSGTTLEVKFQKAEEISLNIKAIVKIKQGYYENSVFASVRENILKYITERVFGLGATVYATEFIVPILEVEGVEAVTSVFVKKLSDVNYVDSVALSRDELPVFSQNSITLSQN